MAFPAKMALYAPYAFKRYQRQAGHMVLKEKPCDHNTGNIIIPDSSQIVGEFFDVAQY